MNIGRLVWLEDSKAAWIPVTIKACEYSNKKYLIDVQDTEGHITRITQESNQESDQLKYSNDKQDDPSLVDNLIHLNILNEAEILQCLEARYEKDIIYTYTGPILIALNPFKVLPTMYSHKILEFYYNFGITKNSFALGQLCIDEPPPHIFGIATMAYTNMILRIERNVHLNYSDADQSILISGESGAGKTESTKRILQFLTTITSLHTQGSTKTTLMDKVVQSNPILEAFGNAKTARNDNSSRFGKFIELMFNVRGSLIGGSIQTYVLEKVRLVKQQAGERNHHIFYQMVAGGTDDEKNRWALHSLNNFLYANREPIITEDKRGFSEVKEAFRTLNFRERDRVSILDISASLMHLGQIQYLSDSEGEGSVVSGDTEVVKSLATAARLLGVTVEALSISTTVKTSIAQSERFTKKLTPLQACEARDALAKTIYSTMFDTLVSIINTQLFPHMNSEVVASIGVLDIFGFEIFKINSFEQLCINYANETLQHHFNKHVFELEQKEYRAEGIEWSFVDYPDNVLCLELLEAKPHGIFATLDDECFIPRGNDNNLGLRLYNTCQKSPHFVSTHAHKNKHEFCIVHYAGPVVYSLVGFVDKNKNEVPKEAIELFSSSSVEFLSDMFNMLPRSDVTSGASPSVSTKVSPDASVNGGSKKNSPSTLGRVTQRPTVCSNFKEQLSSLLQKIDKTSPYYVRCIKPRDSALNSVLNRIRVAEQLRCGGVLAAIKVSRAGFPYRMLHDEFYFRFRSLVSPAVESQLKLKLPKFLRGLKTSHGDPCKQLLKALDVALGADPLVSKAAQVGRSKVFLPQFAYDLMENSRAIHVYLSCRTIQASMRGYRYRRWYRAAKKSQVKIRRVGKKYILRKEIARRAAARAAALKFKLEMEAAERALAEKTEKERVEALALRQQQELLAAHEAERQRLEREKELARLSRPTVPSNTADKDGATLHGSSAAVRMTVGPKSYTQVEVPESVPLAAPANYIDTYTLFFGDANNDILAGANVTTTKSSTVFPSAWSGDKMLQYFTRSVVKDIMSAKEKSLLRINRKNSTLQGKKSLPHIDRNPFK